MTKLNAFAMGLVMAFSATPVIATDYISAEQLPKWFNDAVKREMNVTETSAISLTDFPINGTVNGKWSDVEKADTYWYYTVNIGSDTPVECWAFQEYDGPANSLVNMMNYATNNIATVHNKALSSKFNYSLDASNIDDAVMLDYQVLYNLGEGSEKVSGLLKGLSAETASGLQICMHNEVGYRETFKEVFTSFVKALDSSTQSSPFFNSINSVEVNQQLVGLAAETFTKDADGDVEIREALTMILPVDASNVAATDTVTRSWSSPDGSLINAHTYSVENGQVSSTFSLSASEGIWEIEGEMQGKPVTMQLEYDGEFVSNFGSYLVVDALNDSEQDTTTYVTWSADTDPTSPTPTTMQKLGKQDGLLQYAADMAGFKVQYSSNEDLVMQSATMSMGPVSMKMAPLYVTGNPTAL